MSPRICEYFDLVRLDTSTIKLNLFISHYVPLLLLLYFREINKLPSIGYLDIFGVLSEQALNVLQNSFPEVGINKFIHSAVARPTVGSRRTSIWGLRTRD